MNLGSSGRDNVSSETAGLHGETGIKPIQTCIPATGEAEDQGSGQAQATQLGPFRKGCRKGAYRDSDNMQENSGRKGNHAGMLNVLCYYHNDASFFFLLFLFLNI